MSENNKNQQVELSKVYISAPYSNLWGYKNTTRIVGTWTLEKKPGIVLQALRTFRPYKDGYVNKIGFRNQGLKNIKVKEKLNNTAISLGVFKEEDWQSTAEVMHTYQREKGLSPQFIEVNVSCPNVPHGHADMKMLKYFEGFPLVVKVPPSKEALNYVEESLPYGVNTFHVSNTLASPRGGISGPILKDLNLPLIEEMKKRWGKDIKIIGGGGVYTISDAKDYQMAGADALSICTVIRKHPISVKTLIHYINTHY